MWKASVVENIESSVALCDCLLLFFKSYMWAISYRCCVRWCLQYFMKGFITDFFFFFFLFLACALSVNRNKCIIHVYLVCVVMCSWKGCVREAVYFSENISQKWELYVYSYMYVYICIQNSDWSRLNSLSKIIRRDGNISKRPLTYFNLPWSQ